MFKSILPTPFAFGSSGSSILPGVPNKSDLIGAWLHQKKPSDNFVLDETPGVDKTREPIRGQGLKFTGVESIYSGYTPTLSSSTTFKIETEVIFSGISSTNQYIVDFRNSISTGFFIGTEANSLELKFRITGTNVNTGVILELNTRYFIEFSYNCSTGVATIILNGIEVYSNTVSYNDSNKATRNLALGRVSYTSAIELLATLGYFRFIENDVPVIEYSFEDGFTDTVYNRISNNYHGTIAGATLSTFRVEDDRITNGDNGSYWNQEGGTDYITIFEEDFSTDVGWTLIEGVFIEDGKLVFNNVPSNSTAAYEGYGSAAGKKVRVTVITSDYVSGLLQVKNFGGSGFLADINGNGTFVFEATINSGGNQNWGFGTSTSSTTIKVDYFKVEIIDVRIPRAVTLNLSLGSNLIPLNFVGINLDSNASVVDGKLVLNSSSGISRYTSIVSSGKTYKIIITVDSVVSGTIKVWVGGNNTPIITTAGTYEYLISKGATNDWVGVNPTQFTGVVSYLSCQEVLSVDSIEPVNTDVLGQPLTYTKPAAINLEMVNSNCGTFDGDNDLVNIINGPISSVEFTWIFWMNLDLATKDETQWRNLFYSGGSNLYYFQSDGVFIRTNDISTNTNYIESAFTTADFTGWKRVVITRTSTGLITTRVGDAVRTFQEDGSTGIAFSINSFSFNVATRNFAGSIYNLLAYTRVLSNDEIDNFNPYSPPTLNLELHWPFSEGEGSFLTDVSGNERHGTLINATLSEFWGTKQNLFHWNIKKGFQKYVDLPTQLISTIVPYDTNGNSVDILVPFFENDFTDNTTGVSITGSEVSLSISLIGGRQSLKVTCGFNENTHRITLPAASGLIYASPAFGYIVTLDCYIPSGQTIDRFVVSNTNSFDVPTSIEKDTWVSVTFYVATTNAFQLRFVNASGAFTLGDLEGEWIAFSNFKMERYLVGNSAILSDLHPAGKWHNGAETEFNAPSCPELVIADKQFDIGFWYDDTTALYSKASQKVLADGGEIILTEEEVRSFLSPNWKRASFLYIPFARKAGKSYSLIGEDLTVDRNSVATEVNRQLLLEQVSANVPRIEFDENGPKGHLIEGQRTNLLGDSYEFDTWSINGLSGQNTIELASQVDSRGIVSAARYTQLTTSSSNGLQSNGVVVESNERYVISAKVKYVDAQYIALVPRAINYQNQRFINFDILNLTVSDAGADVGNLTAHTYGIRKAENGYVLLWAEVSTSETDLRAYLTATTGISNNRVIGSFDIGFAQIEEGSFPSSSIYTEGAAATRLAEGIPMPTAWANAVEDDDVLLTISVTFYDTFNTDDLGLFGDAPSFSGRTFIDGVDGKIRLYSLTNAVQLATGILGLENWINVKNVLVLKKIGTTYTLYVNGIKTDTNTLAGDLKWHKFITVSSRKTIHQLRVDTDNPDNWTDEYCQALSELDTTVPRFEASDIQYADIVDNYETQDTLFADVAEDNKRMKLLQYKNPLTE